MLIAITFCGGKLDCYGIVHLGLPDGKEMALLDCTAEFLACSFFSEADVKLTSKEVASLRLTGSGLFLHCISKLRYEESLVSLLTVL